MAESAELRIEIVDGGGTQSSAANYAPAPQIGNPFAQESGGMTPSQRFGPTAWSVKTLTPVELVAPSPVPVRIVDGGGRSSGVGRSMQSRRARMMNASFRRMIPPKMRRVVPSGGAGRFGGLRAGATAAGVALAAVAVAALVYKKVMDVLIMVTEQQTRRMELLGEGLNQIVGGNQLSALGTMFRFGEEERRQNAERWRQVPLIGELFAKHSDYQAAEIKNLGAAFNQFAALTSTAMQLGQRAAQYDPQVAGSMAMFEVRSMMRDFRLAQDIGPNLSRFIDRFSDLLDKLQEAFTPVIREVLDMLSTLATELGSVIRDLAPAIREAAPAIAAFVKMKVLEAVELLKKLAESMGVNLALAKKRDARDEAADAERRAREAENWQQKLFDELQNQWQPNEMQAAAEEEIDAGLNIPIFRGIALNPAR